MLDGVDVRDVTLRSLRRAIGVISQDPFLFSATVRENIAFGVVDATDEQVEQAARIAQAAEFIERLPDGYDTVIGERGITLSGGQRQRIAIARALIVDPRVLIFDDATAAVDATTESQIKAGLREAMRGRTTIIIAHRLSTISLADEIVVLDDGTIAAHGHTRRAARDECRLPRDLRARPARAGVRRRASRRPREGPPAGQHADARARRQDRRLVVARDRAAHLDARAADRAVQGCARRSRSSSSCSRRPSRSCRPISRSWRSTRGSTRTTPPRCGGSSRSSSPPGSA